MCFEYFASEKVKINSIIASQNRNTLKDGSITKHTGGSIPFREIERRMRNKGEVVNQWTLHGKTHTTKEGQPVDGKSRRVRDEYERDYTSDHGSCPTPESSFDPEKWLKSCGGASKGRVYSFGNTIHARDIIPGEYSSRSTSMIPPPNYVSPEQLQDAISRELEQQLAKQMEEMVKQNEEAITRKERIREEAIAREERIRQEATSREEVMLVTLSALMEKLNSMQGRGGDGSSSASGPRGG